MGLLGIIESIAIGLLVLGVLVLVHESGHFLTAKLCGVGVLEFSIGFGKKIWHKTIHGTRYGIGIIPLGGYVRMVGDDPTKSFDNQLEKPESTVLEPIEERNDPYVKAMLAERNCWFLERGFFVKFAIVFAGPAFNILMALVLAIFMCGFYGASVPSDKPIIGEIFANEMEDQKFPAQEAGFKQNDLVLAINDVRIDKWEEIQKFVQRSQGNELKFLVERDEAGEKKQFELKVTPILASPEFSLVSGNEQDYIIGISVATIRQPLTILESVLNGTLMVYHMSYSTLKGLQYFITGKIQAKSIGGPISIVKYAGESAERGVSNLLAFIIYLSVSLAILNLLPIPILDGGHLLFFILGLFFTKGNVNLKLQDYANRIGLALLMSLMLFAIGNDIFRLFK